MCVCHEVCACDEVLCATVRVWVCHEVCVCV